MGYPKEEPTWQTQQLDSLAAQNKLFGVNPLVLAGIASGESGYEVRGPGINSSGYGGFFGLGQHSSYSFGGSTFQDTPAELMDPGSASFALQAQTAAAEVAHLLSGSGGNLQKALASYTGGGPDNIDYRQAISFLGSAAPAGPNSTTSSNQAGEAGSGGVSGATTTAASTGTSQQVTSPTKSQLTGVSGILQDLDSFLNPHIQTTGSNVPVVGPILTAIPNDIEDTLILIVGRGLLTLFFLGIAIGGVYMIVKKPANAALGVVGGVALPIARSRQASTRLSQSQEHLNISKAAEQRRYATSGLQDPFGG